MLQTMPKSRSLIFAVSQMVFPSVESRGEPFFFSSSQKLFPQCLSLIWWIWMDLTGWYRSCWKTCIFVLATPISGCRAQDIVGSVFFLGLSSAEATLDVAATRAEIQSLRTEVERLRRLQDTAWPRVGSQEVRSPTCLEIIHVTTSCCCETC